MLASLLWESEGAGVYRSKSILRVTFLSLACLSAITSAAQVPDNSYQELHWRMIGPLRGGRTRAAAGVPSQPNVFYVGQVNGGVWKSEDYGRSWNPIFDKESTQSIGAIAVSPSDPNVIYVASGEGLHRPDLSVGNGIYKSTDAGKTWTHLGLRDGQQIPALAIDPRDPNKVFAAVLGHPYGPSEERGIYRSTDGGQNWTPRGAAAQAAVTVPLHAVNGSGQEGVATISAVSDQETRVVIQLAGGAVMPQPAHIHAGVCSGIDPKPAYPLDDVVNGRSETTLPIPMARIVEGAYFAINVHKSAAEIDVYVACGDIPVTNVSAQAGAPAPARAWAPAVRQIPMAARAARAIPTRGHEQPGMPVGRTIPTPGARTILTRGARTIRIRARGGRRAPTPRRPRCHARPPRPARPPARSLARRRACR